MQRHQFLQNEFLLGAAVMLPGVGQATNELFSLAVDGLDTDDLTDLLDELDDPPYPQENRPVHDRVPGHPVPVGKEPSLEEVERIFETENRNRNIEVIKFFVDNGIEVVNDISSMTIEKHLQLSYREWEIIKLRHGIGDGYCHTLEEVAHRFKITMERTQQIETKALQKMVELFNRVVAEPPPYILEEPLSYRRK